MTPGEAWTRRRVLALLAPAAALGGCGYALVGRGVTTDPSIKRIGVPLFRDATGKPGLDQKITQRVIEELLKRGRFDVVQERAGVDALVEGEWTGGLKAVDALARVASGKPFLDLSAAERTALLEQLANPGPASPTEEPPDRGQPAEEKPETIGQCFFVELKAWTVRAYYTSRIGIHDEMEYKGNTFLVEFAGTDPASLPPLRPPED